MAESKLSIRTIRTIRTIRITDVSTDRNMCRSFIKILLLASLTATQLTGCSQLSQKDSTVASDTATPAEITDKSRDLESNDYRPFEKGTLYDLLSAEMAAKDSRLDITLGNYLKQAHHTKDTAVIARAMRIARYMKAHQATLDAARLWLSIEPNEVEALQMASMELIRIGRFGEAMEHIDTLLSQSAAVNFDFLVEGSQSLTDIRRKEVLNSLSTLLDKFPNHPQLWFTRALLQEQNGDKEAALKDIDQTIFIKKDYLSAIFFKAKLLTSLNRGDESIELLKKTLKRHPDNKQIRITYTRTLIEQNKLEPAQQQFETLVKKFPDDADLLLSLALISWENKLEANAIQYLEMLITQGQKVDEAHSYLGSIADQKGDFSQAIIHYRQVSRGMHFARAQIYIAKIQAKQGNLDAAVSTLQNARAQDPQNAIDLYITQSELLAEAQRFEPAITLLSNALVKNPNDHNLLYSRAIISEKAGNLNQLEVDLRAIIATNPNSAMALNALGYTLADKTDRLDEAFNLVQRAITLEPNDPAIIDSLGWIYFKRNDFPKAIHFLQKAYEIFPDGEIAAHLGEVLWRAGKKRLANKVWLETLEKSPNHPDIIKTMQRLGVKPQ